jgi:UDP-N-acetylglucosamine--N-acetylmuramyl-(pentapeptide) pyrophosphoryl-undecaprenol N-acetylglucosamine transferase
LALAPLPRGRKPVAIARAIVVNVDAVGRADALVRKLAPAAVLGGGGYAAGPLGLAAALRRVPLVLTEIDSHLGVTNRLLAPLAKRVCLAFPLEGKRGRKFIVTGRPVLPSGIDATAARRRFGIEPDQVCVLVSCGSQGSRSINQAALQAFTGSSFRVLHAAGERDLPSLQSPGPHYDLRGFIDGFGDALAAADLVVGRSGGSVFEIAAAGKPAVLIPYPHAAADHQTDNARYLEQAGAAVVIPDAELTGPRLAQEVGRLLADPSRLAAMARASAALARPKAAGEIAAEVMRVARR